MTRTPTPSVWRDRTIRRGLILVAAAIICLAPLRPALAQAAKSVTPDTLTVAVIDKAIAKAKNALMNGRGLQPPRPFLPHEAHHNDWSEVDWGNYSLATWALLEVGESYQSPDIYKRIMQVLSMDSGLTFLRGMRATMLSKMPRGWERWKDRDAKWLMAAMTQHGGFCPDWHGQQPRRPGLGDSFSTAYGVQGLWNVDETGQIPVGLWDLVERRYRAVQDKATGGWEIGVPCDQEDSPWFHQVNGPTTASGVYVLALTDRLLHGGEKVSPGRNNTDSYVAKGLAYLDTHFQLDDPDEQDDFFLYMWTIQRVGHVSGYRSFNGHDWFREVTARFLNTQQGDGTWRDNKGLVLPTGFGLLYLAQAISPLAVEKLQFGDEWNNRPHDVWNFVDYASGLGEKRQSWQIVNIDQPLEVLLEAPIIYIATHRNVKFNPEQLAKLRDYVYAGGTLVCVPEAQLARNDFDKLPGELFPDLPLVEVPKDHPFYFLNAKVSDKLDMQMVSNGARPLMIVFGKDIARDLQMNDTFKGADAFGSMLNIYLYVTGTNMNRGRLETNRVVQKQEGKKKFALAFIEHAGDYNPEPFALTQLDAILANDQNIDLDVQTTKPAGLKPVQRMAWLAATGDARLTDAEAASIRQWLNAGGTLWIDAVGGSDAAQANASALFRQILPGQNPQPLIGQRAAVITGEGVPGAKNLEQISYRLYAVIQRLAALKTPRLAAGIIGNRPAIYISMEELTTGLAGLNHHMIYGYSVESARDLVVNGVLLAMTAPAPVAPIPAPPPPAQPQPAQPVEPPQPEPQTAPAK